MKTTIQIKSIFGKLLFEFEKENNSIKETVIEAKKQDANLQGADLQDANLRGADLRYADLQDADLRYANLQGANLQGVDLRYANLRGVDLRYANLRDADLQDANLQGADLQGANLRYADLQDANLQGANLRYAELQGANLRDVKIKKAIVFTDLYKYIVIPFISEENEKYIIMGCFIRKLSEWEADFWNNDNEFPNDGSERSNMRLFAYETAKRWFDLIETK
jgi:uncharacterized protein YjbI with pentapeptide repeats